MILIVLGGGVVAGSLLKFSKAENSGRVLITIAWGFTVAIAAYTVGGISGAHINLALTIAFTALFIVICISAFITQPKSATKEIT